MLTWAEALKLLGFTTPFVYAAATYGLFLWLDKKASGAAKRSMTSWLQSSNYKLDISSLTMELFERLYTTPLFASRAVLRSAIITILICSVV